MEIFLQDLLPGNDLQHSNSMHYVCMNYLKTIETLTILLPKSDLVEFKFPDVLLSWLTLNCSQRL